MMQNTEETKTSYAITTFGMNNHAIKVDGFRYIQYEDGGEEFYDQQNDPNEWNNIAEDPKVKYKIEELKVLLPEKNVKWDTESKYTFQPYFVEQKARTKEYY